MDGRAGRSLGSARNLTPGEAARAARRPLVSSSRQARLIGACAATRLLLSVGVLLGALVRQAAAQELPEAMSETTAQAADEMVTDRPDVTESATIVPVGWVQVETGGALQRESGVSTSWAGPGTLVRFGVVPRIEGRLGWEGWQHLDLDARDVTPIGAACPECDGPGPEETSGAGDGEVSVKLLLVERQGAIPDLALLPGLTLPVGEAPFTSGAADPSVAAILANDVGAGVGWGANVGLTWPTETSDGSDERSRVAFWSLSFGAEVGPSTGAFLEYFAEDGEDEAAAHALDAGLTHFVAPRVQLDASAGVGLSEAAPDWFVGAGLAFRLGL